MAVNDMDGCYPLICLLGQGEWFKPQSGTLPCHRFEVS